MKLYSDSEVDLLIEEISTAAFKAIEMAAAEAAKAAALAALEREASMLKEVSGHQVNAQFWQQQAEANLLAVSEAKKKGEKNTLIAALIGIFGGIALGVGGTLIIRN